VFMGVQNIRFVDLNFDEVAVRSSSCCFICPRCTKANVIVVL
jgi:hypothetical protein